MATQWKKQKVDASQVNGGNEYENKDLLAMESVNAMFNNSLYASDIVEGMGNTGIYDSSTIYKYPNIVSYQGSSYMAIYKSSGNYASFSNITPTNTTYWKLVAQAGTVSFDSLTSAQKAQLKGDKGDKGDTGATGPQGETGETGATGPTGASIVSTTLIGQDALGGNIYKQKFDDGSVQEFTAPKGDNGSGFIKLEVENGNLILYKSEMTDAEFSISNGSLIVEIGG